ncbi:phosphate ABC transporter substrate-binding protein [Clostridium sp. YIM B02551]|uniref:phosphate ABC transporter substrate-binding protein n=1 Tax=Clostridium sp. YIM B02551 TaxID=2910679 RepID=UPI001EEA1CFA|nr:phosphate ABC transporter substrate-binding protein [Clostridium sp. YIM B02551]
MKRKGIKFTILGMSLVLGLSAFAGCAKKDDTANQTKKLSGSITSAGSTALQPLVEASKDGFNSEYPDITINAQGGGSGTGLTQVSQGAVDVGDSDVFAEESLKPEDAKALVDHKVVAQGFAVVVNKNLNVTNLTKKQIQDIFAGTIKNWKEVGGPDKEIIIVHRPSSSGTRKTFVKVVLDGNKDLENDKLGVTQDSNGAVVQAMEKSDGSISYVSLAYLQSDEAKDKLSGVSIENVAPTKENITTGKYIFWSWGHMYTKGEPSEVVKAFLDYVGSDKNKDVISKQGYINGSEMKVK